MDSNNINVDELLMSSVIRGDFDGIDEALSSGANLFQKTTKGNSLLYVAASRNRFDVFTELLDVSVKGLTIDLNETNSKGETLLMQLVAEEGYEDYIKLLLSKGANPNISSNDGMSPLIQACADKKSEIVQLLIDSGADVNYTIPNTLTTPFLMAASQSSMEICSLLKDAGANVNCLDSFGKNALLTAIYKSEQFMKKEEKVEHANLCLFLSDIGIDINYVAPSGMTALWAASLNRNENLVNHLLDLGANADVSHEIGLEGTMSALHIWMSSDNSQIIKRLLDSGAKLGIPDSNGNTPDAIGFMNPHLKELMLEINADVNSIFYFPSKSGDKVGMPVITSIITMGNKQNDYIKEMISRGAIVSYANTPFEKYEPLLAAISSSSYSIVDTILETGSVDLNKFYRIDDSSSPISPLALLATGGLNSKLSSHIQKKIQYEKILEGKKINDENNVKSKIIDDEGIKQIQEELNSIYKLEENINNQREIIFKSLINNGADINLADESGRTPIFFVNDSFLFNLYLSNGATLNCKDNEGNTPLVYAISNNKESLISSIKQTGYTQEDVFYQLSFCDGDSFFIQNQLTKGILNFCEAPINFLTDQESSLNVDYINFKDEDGNSPLLISCANNLPFLASLYLKLGADINIVNNSNESPLMHSIGSDNPELVKFLVDKGANISLVNDAGKSSLDLSVESNNKEIEEIVKTGLGLANNDGLISGIKRIKP